MMGIVAKAKVGDMEEDVREVFRILLWKELTGGLEGVFDNKRFMLIFQDGFGKDMG